MWSCLELKTIKSQISIILDYDFNNADLWSDSIVHGVLHKYPIHINPINI